MKDWNGCVIISTESLSNKLEERFEVLDLSEDWTSEFRMVKERRACIGKPQPSHLQMSEYELQNAPSDGISSLDFHNSRNYLLASSWDSVLLPYSRTYISTTLTTIQLSSLLTTLQFCHLYSLKIKHMLEVLTLNSQSNFFLP